MTKIALILIVLATGSIFSGCSESSTKQSTRETNMSPVPGSSSPRRQGRVIDRELEGLLTNQTITPTVNLQSFERSDSNSLVTVRYHFNSAAHTAMDIKETVARCGSLKATRIVGQGHRVGEITAFKQTLEAGSDYVVEFDVAVDCEDSSFRTEIWVGDQKEEPIKFLECEDSVLMSISHADLLISKAAVQLVGADVACGIDLTKSNGTTRDSEINSRGVLIQYVPNEAVLGSKRTANYTVKHGRYENKYSAEAQVSRDGKSLKLTCSENSKVFSSTTFGSCRQTYADTKLLRL